MSKQTKVGNDKTLQSINQKLNLATENSGRFLKRSITLVYFTKIVGMTSRMHPCWNGGRMQDRRQKEKLIYSRTKNGLGYLEQIHTRTKKKENCFEATFAK